jgi:hypothetical protein
MDGSVNAEPMAVSEKATTGQFVAALMCQSATLFYSWQMSGSDAVDGSHPPASRCQNGGLGTTGK